MNYALFLIAGSGLVTIARAMTLAFLAIKLQQSFGLGPAAIGAFLGLGPLLGAVVAPFAGSISDRVGRKMMLTETMGFIYRLVWKVLSREYRSHSHHLFNRIRRLTCPTYRIWYTSRHPPSAPFGEAQDVDGDLNCA